MEEQPKRKRGGQPGNKNAVGNRGNPHPEPFDLHTKHGAYRKPVLYTYIPLKDWNEIFLPILREYEKEYGSHRKAKYRELVRIPEKDWKIILEICGFEEE